MYLNTWPYVIPMLEALVVWFICVIGLVFILRKFPKWLMGGVLVAFTAVGGFYWLFKIYLPMIPHIH